MSAIASGLNLKYAFDEGRALASHPANQPASECGYRIEALQYGTIASFEIARRNELMANPCDMLGSVPSLGGVVAI